jgi:signal transduction histidine kinase
MSLEDIKDLTLTMKNDASNVYKLLENLLEWSRLKRGVIEFTPQKISLIEVINESLAVVSEMALKKGITISTNVADETMVFADRHMLETIIRNLISNSIKFSFTDSKIEINSHIGNDNSVKIFVTDNGIGMPEGIKNKLFMLNEKTNRKGTQGEASSGLGLILIKEFVEKHNGTISVESEEGKGSTFTFTLKLDWQIITENL